MGEAEVLGDAVGVILDRADIAGAVAEDFGGHGHILGHHRGVGGAVDQGDAFLHAPFAAAQFDQELEPVDVEADDKELGGVADMLLVVAEGGDVVAQRLIGDADEGVHMALGVGGGAAAGLDDQVQVARRQGLGEEVADRAVSGKGV